MRRFTPSLVAVFLCLGIAPVVAAEEPDQSVLKVYFRLRDGHFAVDRQATSFVPSGALKSTRPSDRQIRDQLGDDLDRLLAQQAKAYYLALDNTERQLDEEGKLDDERTREIRTLSTQAWEDALAVFNRWAGTTPECRPPGSRQCLQLVFSTSLLGACEDAGEDTALIFDPIDALTFRRDPRTGMVQFQDDRTYQIQLLGFLQVNENFEVSYTLDRQVARTGEEQVAATTFTLQTVYVNKNFTNSLQLALKKDDGSPGMTLTIGGQMTAVLGSAQLSVGFAFSQERDGDTVTTTVAFNGSLTWSRGEVQWMFERNAETTTISVAAGDIRLGSATADARINLATEGGQLKGVRALFGISF